MRDKPLSALATLLAAFSALLGVRCDREATPPVLAVYGSSSVGGRSESVPKPAITVPCRVISARDGDTMTVEVRTTVKVRLKDCWAPELKQEGGPEARDRLRELVLGKDAILHVPLEEGHLLNSKRVSFGRVVGHVYVDGRNVGQVLVEEKHATVSRPKRK